MQSKLSCYTMCVPIWYWRDSEGFWIPYTPDWNAEIELSHKIFGEYNYVYNGVIHTINFHEMQDTNEATSERRSVMRKVTEHCNVLSLRKTTACSCVSDCFAEFAYEYFCERIRNPYISPPEYFCCWEGLRALLNSVTDQQLSKLFRARSRRHSWCRSSLTRHVRNLLYDPCTELRILAMDILLDLMRRDHRYIRLLKKERTEIFIRLIAQDYEITNLSGDADQPQEVNVHNRNMNIWLRAQAKKFIEYGRFGKVHEFKINDLENLPLGILYDLFISTPCTLQPPNSLRSRILKYFIYFLTSTRGPTDRPNRLREFLELLANIPRPLAIEGHRIHATKFVQLLHRLGEIVENVITHTQSNPYSYFDPGIDTIERISEHHLNVHIHDKSNSINLKVAPFTSAQYLENFVLHKVSGTGDEFRDEVSEDVSFTIRLYINGNRIPSEMTIYEAVHHFVCYGKDKKIFEMTHEIEYLRKPRSEEQMSEFELFSHPLDRHLRERSPCPGSSEDLGRALQLIDILYGLNEYWTTLYSGYNHQYIINPKRFLIKRIDYCIRCELSDPFRAIMGKLRTSSVGEVIRNCPFILSLRTRRIAFKMVCADRRRALMAALHKHRAGTMTINLNRVFKRVIVKRDSVLTDMNKALKSTRGFSYWDVTFEEEVGAGIGLAKELFTLASRELQKADLGLWASSGVTITGYLQMDTGLYPAVNPRLNEPCESNHSSDLLPLDRFKSVGQLLGKALMEGQMLDLPLALPVFKWLLNQESQLTLEDVVHVNPAVHKVLEKIQWMVKERDKLNNNPNLTEDIRNDMMKNINVDGETVDSYLLDFVLPGVVDIIELIPKGSETSVSLENSCRYLEKVVAFLLKSGVQRQMDSLRLGLSSVISLDHLQIFRPQELMTILCGEDDAEYWTVKHMKLFVEIDGFNKEELPVVYELFRLWSSLSGNKQRLFLQFITGYSRLPVGGFKGLDPRLCVSRTTLGYPYAQSCLNTLHIPRGITSCQLNKFIQLATTEGLNCFGIV